MNIYYFVFNENILDLYLLVTYLYPISKSILKNCFLKMFLSSYNILLWKIIYCWNYFWVFYYKRFFQKPVDFIVKIYLLINISLWYTGCFLCSLKYRRGNSPSGVMTNSSYEILSTTASFLRYRLSGGVSGVIVTRDQSGKI